MKHLLLQVAMLAGFLAAAAQTTHPRPTHEAVVQEATVKTKVKAAPTSDSTVYYCASGNTVKYHASPNCQGLSRCRAVVVPLRLARAQQFLTPCRWCYGQ